MPRETLLKRLEAKRRALHLSQEKFAGQILGISFTTYQRWLHEKFNPDYQTIQRLEALLADEDITALTAATDPVLAELWDNEKDAAYDEL